MHHVDRSGVQPRPRSTRAVKGNGMRHEVHKGSTLEGHTIAVATREDRQGWYAAIVAASGGMDAGALARLTLDHVIAANRSSFLDDGPVTSDDLGSWCCGLHGDHWPDGPEDYRWPLDGLVVVQVHRKGFVVAWTTGDAHVAMTSRPVGPVGRDPWLRRLDDPCSGTLVMAAGPGADGLVRAVAGSNDDAPIGPLQPGAGAVAVTVALPDMRAEAAAVRAGWWTQALAAMGVEDTPENRRAPIPYKPFVGG